jgi:hypothetical protein
LPGCIEGEGVGRHEGLQDAQQSAGKSRVGGGDDERRQFVAVDVVTDGRRAQRIVTDGAEDRPDGGTHDANGDDDAYEVAQRKKLVE